MRICVVTAVALCLAACGGGSSGPSGSANPDADGDGFASSADCNDNNAAAWQTISVFADTDRDGVGAAPAVSICAGAATPAGYSSSSTDCAVNDPAIHTPMSYAARDADGDAFLVASAGSVCGNGTALPSGYFSAMGSAAADCDDASTSVWRPMDFYEDFDRDGVGAGTTVSICAGATTPAGYSSTSTDCADNDVAVHTLMPYGARDADGDTALVASTGSVCGNGVNLPPTYFATAGSAAADCDDDGASVWRQASLFEDYDHDGVGHGAASSFCLGSAAMPGFVDSSFDCDYLDATKWRMVATYKDVDGDGVGSGAIVPLCVGAAPPPGSSFQGFDPLDTPDPASALVSDFELNIPGLFVESEADEDDVFP